MHSTSPSLLDQLRGSASDEAWSRFVRLYTPLLLQWAKRLGLESNSAADLVQDVFLVLMKKMPEFRYAVGGSFRGWLRTVLTHRNVDRLRKRDVSEAGASDLAGLSVADPIGLVDEAEYRRYLVAQALKLMKAEFSENTWKACWEHVVNDRPAADVAGELGIHTGSVYVAKSRVLARLREELAGLAEL